LTCVRLRVVAECDHAAHPRPGVGLDHLIQTLDTTRNEAFNLWSGGGPGPAHKRLLGYLDWAGRAARMLGGQISEADLAALVLNRRYEVLLASFGNMASPEVEVQRVVNDLVSLELDERVKDFDAAIKTLKDERDRWARAGVLVIPDTSFYIRHPDKLEEVDFAPLLGLREYGIHVLVPMVIVDELDGLKQASKQPARWRAGYTLAVLHRLFQTTPGPAMLRDHNFSTLGTGDLPRGRVEMGLLFDPPGHMRLPINDDEIVDRAVAVQALAKKAVTLLTYDTGQSMRARNAGLKEVKLTEDIGPEPTPEDSRRGLLLEEEGAADASVVHAHAHAHNGGSVDKPSCARLPKGNRINVRTLQ